MHACFFLLLILSTSEPAPAAEPKASAIDALLKETAEQLGESRAEEGKGYSYYTCGTDELLYTVGGEPVLD